MISSKSGCDYTDTVSVMSDIMVVFSLINNVNVIYTEYDAIIIGHDLS